MNFCQVKNVPITNHFLANFSDANTIVLCVFYGIKIDLQHE